MILSLSIWLPIIFGLIILFTGSDNSKGYVRIMALVATLISFAATLPLFSGFDTSTAAMQFVEQVSWVPRYDINYF
jgi:NADH-quinone oxidoreductase subunit M